MADLFSIPKVFRPRRVIKSEDHNDLTAALKLSFDSLGTAPPSGKTGVSSAFAVGTATDPVHAVTKAQMDSAETGAATSATASATSATAAAGSATAAAASETAAAASETAAAASETAAAASETASGTSETNASSSAGAASTSATAAAASETAAAASESTVAASASAAATSATNASASASAASSSASAASSSASAASTSATNAASDATAAGTSATAASGSATAAAASETAAAASETAAAASETAAAASESTVAASASSANTSATNAASSASSAGTSATNAAASATAASGSASAAAGSATAAAGSASAASTSASNASGSASAASTSETNAAASETAAAALVADGDKGDVTLSASGSVWTIDNGAVSLPKMANIATASFIGRSTAGTGVPEALDATAAIGVLGLGTVYDKDTGTTSGTVPLNGAAASFTAIDATGNIEITSALPGLRLKETDGNTGYNISALEQSADSFFIRARNNSGSAVGIDYQITKGTSGATQHQWRIAGSEAMTLDSSQNLLVGKTSASIGTNGFEASSDGLVRITRSSATPLDVNRNTDDGALVTLRQAGTSEGSISVSGTTVSYNGAHLSRWSQWEGSKVTDTEKQGRPEVLRGSILSNTDEMCEWFAVEWDEVIPAEFEEVIHYRTKTVKEPKVSYEIIDGKAVKVVEVVEADETVSESFPIFENGKPVIDAKTGNQKTITRPIVDKVEKVEKAPEKTVKHHELYDGDGELGDVIDFTTEAGEVVKATIIREDNEQLNRMKVSCVAGDKSVSGVFQDYDLDDNTAPYDFYCAMTGDFVIRIGKGVKVKNGDLIESAGDGTGRSQSDDIVRSSTVAKVTSASITETYADGSYIVPCVLMAC